MAGKPGRSGGARAGAGRKPSPPALLDMAQTFDDPKAFLAAVMNSPRVDLKLRVAAGKALMPFEHSRRGDQGKKVAQREEGNQLLLEGFFAPPAALTQMQ